MRKQFEKVLLTNDVSVPKNLQGYTVVGQSDSYLLLECPAKTEIPKKRNRKAKEVPEAGVTKAWPLEV